PIKWVMWLGTKPKEIRPGLFRTINASYTRDEVQRLLAKTRLKDASVGQSPFGLDISGQKKN
ncbi:MAG: class I SAM-dependent methyltransferase, partial [Anaerolineae bacterium]|nr:class I SAM-dependent methyltransferase [Anaerolineae bacterium]